MTRNIIIEFNKKTNFIIIKNKKLVNYKAKKIIKYTEYIFVILGLFFCFFQYKTLYVSNILKNNNVVSKKNINLNGKNLKINSKQIDQYIEKKLNHEALTYLTINNKNNLNTKNNLSDGLSAKNINNISQFIAQRYKIAPAGARLIILENINAAVKYNLSLALLLAMEAVESRFNPIAGSSSGAIGLTQTLPDAHPNKIIKLNNEGGSIIDISDNINLGASILREYINQYHGNIELALQQYNGNVKDKSKSYSKAVLYRKRVFERYL